MKTALKTTVALVLAAGAATAGLSACGSAKTSAPQSVQVPMSAQLPPAESAAQTAAKVEAKISAKLPGGAWSERGADVTGAYAVESYLNADSIPPVSVSQYRDLAVAEQAVSYYSGLGYYSPVVADGSIVIAISNTATPAEVAAIQSVLPAAADSH